MSEKIPRPVAEVAKSIEDQAALVRQAAEELTDRIEWFESYVGRLKGRVDTTYYATHPDEDPSEGYTGLNLGIRLHRDGKSWILSWGESHEQFPDQLTKWQPLKEAPLKIKIAAISAFPDFLGAIEKSQMQLAKEITEATAKFDAFASTLKITGKERD